MSDLSALILRHLLKLKDIQETNAIINDTGSVKTAVEFIHETCLNYSFRKQEIATAYEHLFNNEFGIVTFLSNISLVKDCKDVKLECFKLFDDIIDQSKSFVKKYGIQIKDISVSYLKRETSADMKKAALVTLSKVLEMCPGIQGDEKIDVPKLMTDLYGQLSLGSKLTPTVKEELLCLIGMVAHYYPEDFIPYQERVLNMFLQELKIQVTSKTKSPNFNIISGCLLGLKEYLYNFSVSYTEDMEKSYQIFDYARKMISNIKFTSKTSSSCRASLQLMAAHAPQFNLFMYEIYDGLYNEMMQWVLHNNRDLQKMGQNAVVALLKEVSDVLVSKYSEDKSSCNKVFMFFMNSFRDAFLSKSNSREINIAVIGYGLFAGVCKLCLSDVEVKAMMLNIIQRSEVVFFSEDKKTEDKIMLLPSYLESLSSIICEIDHISESTLFALEKLVVFQIENFPYVPTAYQFIVPRAIVRILLAMQRKDIFMGFLSRIVYQGIVRTCSHTVKAEAEILKDEKNVFHRQTHEGKSDFESRIITYQDYIFLWQSILNVVKIKELSALSITLEERQILKESVYDQIITCNLSLIRKLDLSLLCDSNKDNEELDTANDVSSDPVHDVQPRNITDHHIFINLVDFSRELLSNYCIELFGKWVFVFGQEIIYYSAKNPYISGFYKLIALNLSICSELEYFKALSSNNFIQNEFSNDVERSFHLFSKFVKEIIAWIQQFKDDLLSSCLQVLLVLPMELVIHDIHILIPALQGALKIGVSYLPLANIGLDALEKWSQCVPERKMRFYYPEILPLLNSYLVASVPKDSNVTITQNEFKSSHKKSHKMAAKLTKPLRQIIMMVDETELQKIQFRIITFLGRLGGQNNQMLLEKAFEKVDDVAIAWDPAFRNHLKYAVPFVDIKPEIYFDDFLPQVLDIATKSSNRQMKVAACEALHSLVLFMVGRSSQIPESHQEKLSMEALYKKLFPGLLELACDIEQVTKQLFHPLVIQLIHWFSSSRVLDSPESSTVLNSLWEAVTHNDNASLRDFSSICLKEFFLWSLKQSSNGKLKHAENILNKILSFSLHPSPFKRLGAVLTFNNIYRIFRNEEKLMQAYTLQLLVQFVDSLAIAHNDDKSLGTQNQCVVALNHLEKILSVKHHQFLEPKSSSKVPICLEEATLMSAVKWLLKQCGCIQTECRRKSMDMVIKLSPFLPGIRNAEQFIQAYIMKNNIFEDVFERSLIDIGLPSIEYPHKLTFWLEALLATLESYNWAFSQKLLPQINESDGKYFMCSNTQLFNAMEFFIKKIVKEGKTTVNDQNKESWCNIFSPKELIDYLWLKCTVLVRILNFIVAVIQDEKNCFHSMFMETIWNCQLFEVIIFAVVDPSVLGFDIMDLNVKNNLETEVLNALKACLCGRTDFKDYCEDFLLTRDKYNISNYLPIDFHNENLDAMQLACLIKGYQLLIDVKLWPGMYSSHSSKQELITSFLNSVWNGNIAFEGLSYKQKILNPASFTLANKMMSMCYSLGLKPDDLVRRLLETFPGPVTQASVRCGWLIFNIFETSICEFASKEPESFVSALVENIALNSFEVISILIKFLDCVAREKTLRKRYGKQIIEAFLQKWTELICLWHMQLDEDIIYSILSIMTKMLLIDSQVALNTDRKFSKSIFKSYLELLKKPNSSMDLKIRTLDILPFFIDSHEENCNALRLCIEEVISTSFPISSKELHPASSAHNSYISAVKKLLSALRLTACYFLFELLTVLFCKEDEHSLEEEFLKCIGQLVKRKTPSEHKKLAEIPFNLIQSNDNNFPPEMQLSIMDKVCLLVLKDIVLSAFVQFYSSHIKSLILILKERDSSFEREREHQLVMQIQSFKLLELLYNRLPKDMVHTKESQVVEAFLGMKPNVGNELSTEITKLALEFKKRSLSMESSLKNLVRKLNCAAYNALIAVVSCTQIELKFYNAFLFKRNAAKNECIWENIVDSEKCFNFSIEFSAPTSRQKKFVSIRHNLRDSESPILNDTSIQVESSVRLFGTQNLSLSSLAEDVSKFDFSTTDQVFSSKVDETTINDNSNGKDSDANYLEMELDELNKHECMVALSGLLQHMSSQGFFTEETSIPMWLDSIAEMLEDRSCSKAIRLFLGRVVINNARILEPYAKTLIRPLMSLLVSGTAGVDLNYYIVDLIITMLSWSSVVSPKDNCPREANELLKFVISNCGHDRKDIFRNNLEVIKTILDCWGNELTIPYESVYEQMQNKDPNNKHNMIGIQVLGIIASSGFPPFDESDERRGQSFLSLLLKHLFFKYKEVYASASEVIGIILKYMQERQQECYRNEFYEKVVSQLDTLRISDKGKFLYCLNKIHAHIPHIADRFAAKLLLLHSSVYGIFQTYALEILCTRIIDVNDGYQQLKSIGLFDDIEQKDESSQLLLLQALEKVSLTLDCDDVLNILPIILRIHSQPNVRSRHVLYKILSVLFDKFSKSNGAKEKEIARLAQETLLLGLTDPDETLRLTVDNFWSNEKRLPVSTRKRLLALMTNMYSPLTEESFLQYATFLLLERTSYSPDYKRKLFEHPLSECSFQAYNIQTSWRKRHAAMTPMFTESASSSLNLSLMSLDGNVSRPLDNFNLVKATQANSNFPETVDADMKGDTYNWLTEKSVDTFAVSNLSSTGGGSYESSSKSHLIAMKKNIKQSKDAPKSLDASSNSKQIEKTDKDKLKSSVWMLRRRFLKDKTESEVFAKRELRRQDLQKERLKEQQFQRDAQVTMYRQYRIGELPDIEISNAAIIAPIQVLAMNDATIAKILFRSLLVSICCAIKEESYEEYKKFCEDIGQCLINILQSSHMYCPTVIAFCLESINYVDNIKFDAEQILNASKAGNQESLGIILIETKLLKGFDGEPPRKKIKQMKPSLSENMNHWMKLAELYRSLNDYDVVNGIFSHTMGNKEQNRKALQFETSGKYFDAAKIYSELYEETEESDQAEKDFWDNSILSCYSKLTKWDSLEATVLSHFTDAKSPDLHRIWDDQYYKDNYLPYLIQSKIKLLINGKVDQSLLTFFEESEKDEEKKAHFEDHFTEELAILNIIQDKFETAKHYNLCCFNKFLKEWQNTSPLAVEVQLSKMQNLQKFVEMDEFLSLIKQAHSTNLNSVEKVLKLWQLRIPNKADPVNIWDDVDANRNFYLNILQKRYAEAKIPSIDSSHNSQGSTSGAVLEEEITNNIDKLCLKTLISFKLLFVENCCVQKNFPVAVDNLKLIHRVSKSLEESLWTKFIVTYCSTNNARATSSTSDCDRKLDLYIGSWEQLEKLEKRCGSSVSQKIIQSQSLELMAEMFTSEEIEFSLIESEKKLKIFDIAGVNTEHRVVLGLLQRSFCCLSNIVESLKTDLSDTSMMMDGKKIASAHLNLAKFCNKYLRQEEAGETNMYVNIPSFASYPAVLTESVLVALSYGDQEALQLIPRLLQIMELHPSTLSIFLKNSSRVPTWMFLGWINQMLALLDKPEGNALHSLIQQIVELYPNAIIYAFHLSCENFDFPSTREGDNNKAFVKRMRSSLEKHNLIHDFVAALDHLSVCHILFKDYVTDIVHMMKKNSSQQEILNLFNKMWTRLFSLTKSSRIPQGPQQENFAKNFRDEITDICGENGVKLLDFNNIQNIQQALSKLYDSGKKDDKKLSNLKDVSPWLSKFRSWENNTHIEIPGQYTGKSKPILEYHVRIAGFDEKVLVLSSATSPRRITIRGNDEKEYKILVKTGEDLRQDARLQQIFSVMNDIFTNDAACSKRHIKLLTYKVVPLSTRLGLIEWVDNTIILSDFLTNAMSKEEFAHFHSGSFNNIVQEKFYRWASVQQMKTITSMYDNLYLSKSREDCLNKYDELVKIVPENLFSKSFLKLSSSPEAFLTLRTKFAKSHAAICVCQWILGIGDRHLGNFLIDERSGCEIGIDFGHAFGSATQFLPTPEMIPFRLTPQYLQLMGPLQEKGVYESTMVHVLAALSSKQDILLNIMDIFIKEPTLDWKVNARKQQQALGITFLEDDADWYPKQRVLMAQKKLEGTNPCYITRQELKLGHCRNTVFESFELVCLGDSEHNIRAKLPAAGLSVEEQVSCLIDQATDPHILCKTYFGWNPWM